MPRPLKTAEEINLHLFTVYSASRRKFLTSPDAVGIMTAAWKVSPVASRWVVGRYLIMPDHVHFFARPQLRGKVAADFVSDWKIWTARLLTDVARIPAPVWQPDFFDQVVNSAEDYAAKWTYVGANPVRAGHAATADAWPYTGELERLPF